MISRFFGGAILLLLPAMLNGAPLLYFDTFGYVSHGEKVFHFVAGAFSGAGGAAALGEADARIAAGGNVIDGRSAFYGVFAYAGLRLTDFWAVGVIQALAFAFVVAMLYRALRPSGGALGYYATMALAAIATPAALFVSLAMPDIWVGLGAISVILMGLGWSRFAPVERALMGGIAVFAMLSHQSHLMLLASLALAILASRLLPARLRPSVSSRGLSATAICIGVAVAGFMAYGAAVKQVTGEWPIKRPFLTAHLIDSGPGVDLLDSLCVERSFAVCGRRDVLPVEWRRFLFDRDPASGVFATADAATQRRLAEEDLSFALAALQARPLGVLSTLVGDGFWQLALFGVDGVPFTEGRASYLGDQPSLELANLAESGAIYDRPWLLAQLTRFSYLTAILALGYLGYMALRGGFAIAHGAAPPARPPDATGGEAGAIVAFCLLAVLGNALICGGLASPYDRFQARIIWLVPVLAALLVLGRQAARASSPDQAGLGDYLRIARFDHVTKHVFIVPGVMLAGLLRGVQVESLPWNLVMGGFAAICIASANYVINEWLDREFDAHHPEKSQRAAVKKPLKPELVYLEYALLLVCGLLLAAQVNPMFFAVAAFFGLSGVIYNVEPLRSKDKVYVDVLTESVNNPLRLLLGWSMVDPTTLPPASLLMAFWFGGAFLMNSKRLAEYRDIAASDGVEVLARYRRSFRDYDEGRLSVANLIYALCCAFFLAIFLIKYRVEYILLFPFVVALFAQYYALALRPGSVARKPELLYKTRSLVTLAAVTCGVFGVATVVEIPALDHLTEQFFIPIR